MWRCVSASSGKLFFFFSSTSHFKEIREAKKKSQNDLFSSQTAKPGQTRTQKVGKRDQAHETNKKRSIWRQASEERRRSIVKRFRQRLRFSADWSQLHGK